MQVVDTNRSKASFTRLNNKRLKELERKRNQPTRKKQRDQLWSEVLNPICAVVRGGFASFLEKLRSGRENPPLAQTTKRSKRVEDPPTGGNDGEVPPVPIPNTEVKLSSAESTWLDTAREDRSLPVPP